MIFIYKLGTTWGDKKTICNKIPQNSPITAMCWPSQRMNNVVYGLADGKVRMVDLKTTKVSNLFTTESYVVSMCVSPDGNAFVTGHADGTIYRYNFPTDTEAASHTRLVQTQFAPYALGWGEHICAGGNVSQVYFYDLTGNKVQSFDYASDLQQAQEFFCAAVNPSGQTVVLGSFNRFLVYSYNSSKQIWEQAANIYVENLYTVTALRWKADGSRLVTGSLCGAVDLYDACIRRVTYGGKYEFTYTSPNSVIVKRLQTGAKTSVASRFHLEIKKVNIYSDRYIVATTLETMILGDLKEGLMSEIPWSGSGKEKFYFDNQFACMVFNAGELSVVE